MSDVEKTIEDLNKIAMLTGEISSLHEKSLKTYPYIVFNGVKDFSIKYDISKDYTKENGEGYFTFDIEIEKEQDLLDKRCENLTEWVRNLFWREIKIEIYLNGKLEYKNSTLGNKEN